MMPIRLQIQAIADRLAGLPSEHIDPDELTPPWSLCWMALNRPIPQGPQWSIQRALVQALEGRDDVDAALAAILSVTPGERPTYPSLHDQEPTFTDLRWLWPNWIPRGMLSLLGGEPGAGKSLFALDLVRLILEGLHWPDGAPNALPPGARCLYIDTEGVPRLIRQRASAWGMDTTRLYLMLPAEDDLIDLSGSADQTRLEEMLYTLQPTLVVVDSLGAVHKRGENKVDEVRTLLAYLTRLARRHDCGMLLVHHLRKRPPGADDEITIDDFRGSTHIVAMARSILSLTTLQESPREPQKLTRRVAMVKSNLTALQPPFGIRLQPVGDSVRLHYTQKAPLPYHKQSEAEHCSEWLREILRAASEPLTAGALTQAAQETGYSRTTLFRARQRLGRNVQTLRGASATDSRWVWADDDPDDLPYEGDQ